jgi:hypothetical protein
LINLPLLAELFGLLRQLRPALFLRRGERHRKKENNQNSRSAACAQPLPHASRSQPMLLRHT